MTEKNLVTVTFVDDEGATSEVTGRLSVDKNSQFAELTYYYKPPGKVPCAPPMAIAYAYSPRENVGSTGGNHAQLLEPLVAGRLKREKHDTLCKPYRKFWGLHTVTTDPSRKVTCKRCRALALKLGFRLPNE